MLFFVNDIIINSRKGIENVKLNVYPSLLTFTAYILYRINSFVTFPFDIVKRKQLFDQTA